MKKVNYLYAPALTLIIFIVWTILVKTVDVKYIQAIGNLGFYTLNTNFASILQGMGTKAFDLVTDLLLYASLALVGLFAVIGLFQLIKRQSFKKVDPIIYILLGGYILMVIFYFVFELVKINFGPTSTPDNLKASYPSSHVFIFMTIVGTSLVALRRYKDVKLIKNMSYVEFALLSILMAVLRLFSGQHYVTDIIGGVFLGFLLVTAVFECDRFFYKEICDQKVENNDAQ